MICRTSQQGHEEEVILGLMSFLFFEPLFFVWFVLKGGDEMEIYQLIAQYRDMSGMSQIEAAKELSITPSALSKYENNNAQISIKMFVQMCKI